MKQDLAPEHDAAARIFARSDGLTALIRTLDAPSADPAECSTVDIQLPVGSKLLNFKRKAADQLSQVLQRMRISCSKALKDPQTKSEAVPKRARVQNTPDTPSLSIEFLTSSDDVVSEDLSLQSALEQASKIRIEEKVYSLIVDPPVCTSIEVATEVWVGFPVVPNVTVVGAPETEFQYEYRIVSEDGNDVLESFTTESPVYVATESQRGKFLEIRCFHPRYPQFYLGCSSVDRISQFEGQASRLTAPLPSPADVDTIRVSTFNILAQPYVRTPLAMDAYYTHLHKCWHLTEWSRRCPLILREMLDTNSDIYCLQEVAAGSHSQLIERAISKEFDWNYFGKASQANNGNPIGVTISLRKSKFEVVETTKLELGSSPDSLLFSELSEEEGSQISDRFGDLFFSDVLKGINTVAGVIHARTKNASQDDVLIANTHLFFHPFGGHIRVLQGLCLMRALARMRALIEASNGGRPVGVIVCGDFNSRPDSGSFKVMHTGQIHPEHEDWQYGKSFRYEKYRAQEDKSEEVVLSLAKDADTTIAAVEGIHAKHSLNISHVPSHIPELTHATAAFRATLDYVFFSADTFTPVEGPGTGSSLPELTHAEVDAMGGLPFAHYGSDHVLVCGDLSFSRNQHQM